MERQIKNFFDLEAWQQAHRLALDVYSVTMNFPKSEQYGLISQLRRAASSVSANIAEGFERFHYKDKSRFYYQARGSCAEVQNFAMLARDLHFIDSITFARLDAEASNVRQLINGLIRSIEKQQ